MPKNYYVARPLNTSFPSAPSNHLRYLAADLAFPAALFPRLIHWENRALYVTI